METRATTPADRQATRELMKTAFGGRDLLTLSEAMMSWKYDHPRPDWDAERSIVAVENGRIVAHVGVWPLELPTPRGPIQCVHLIDWVADRSNAGAGAAVYMAGQTLAPVSIVIGGSEEARHILPKLGFRPAGEMKIYARPLRIWRQFLHRPNCSPGRRAALMLRNALWRGQAGFVRPAAWTAEPVKEFTAVQTDWFGGSGASEFTIPARNRDGMNYLLACPDVSIRAWAQMKREAPRDLLVLALAGRQMRVADVRVAEETVDRWTSAYATAIDLAMKSVEADELSAGSSSKITDVALEANGFRVRGIKPLWVRDRSRLLEGAPPLRLQMADSDGFFIYDAGEPYLT